MELVKIEDNYGYVSHGGKEYKVELSLIDKPQIGDWLLAHGEIAVSRIPSQEAKDILELIKSSHTN